LIFHGCKAAELVYGLPLYIALQGTQSFELIKNMKICTLKFFEVKWCYWIEWRTIDTAALLKYPDA
jgi:hypothetical protein